MGLVKLVDIQTVLAGIAGMPFVSLKDRVIDADVLKCIPPESARSYQIVPLEYDSTTKKVLITLKGPESFRAVDDIRMLLGLKVSAVVAAPEEVEAILKKHYQSNNRKINKFLEMFFQLDVFHVLN